MHFPQRQPLPWTNWLSSPLSALRAALCVAWQGGAAPAWQHAIRHHKVGLAQALLAARVPAHRVEPAVVARLLQVRSVVDSKAPGLRHEILAGVLKAGADPNGAHDHHVRSSLLHHAVCTWDPVKVGLLLKHGADPNALNAKGMNALEASIVECSTWDMLGDAAYDPAAPLNCGSPAVRGVVLQLIRAGADTVVRNNDGCSLLSRAPLDFDILKALVEHGCDPNAPLMDPAKGPKGRNSCLLFRVLEAEPDGLGIWLSAMQKFGLGTGTVAPDGTTLAMKAVGNQYAGNKIHFDAIRAAGFPFTGVDGAGNTVLHVWASQVSSAFGRVGELLLGMPEVAALASVRNVQGKTAADLLVQDRGTWVENSDAARWVSQLRALELGKTLGEVLPVEPEFSADTAPMPARRRRL